jgi:hypothetical protein
MANWTQLAGTQPLSWTGRLAGIATRVGCAKPGRLASVLVLLAGSVTLGGLVDATNVANATVTARATFAAACPPTYTSSQKAAARVRAHSLLNYLVGAPISVLAGNQQLTDPRIEITATVFRSELTSTDLYKHHSTVVASVPDHPKAWYPDATPKALMYYTG